MPHYDREGGWLAQPVPKGERKTKKEKTPSTKIVKRGQKPDLAVAAEAVKTKGGSAPRRSGNRVERLVAKSLGGERTVGSGAYKHTNHNLTGDVEVRDNEGRDWLKLEVKATGAVTSKGEKSYCIKLTELEQMQREAHEANEKGALIFHFKGQPIEKAWAILSMEDLKELIDEAKLGRTARL